MFAKCLVDATFRAEVGHKGRVEALGFEKFQGRKSTFARITANTT